MYGKCSRTQFFFLLARAKNRYSMKPSPCDIIFAGRCACSTFRLVEAKMTWIGRGAENSFISTNRSVSDSLVYRKAFISKNCARTTCATTLALRSLAIAWFLLTLALRHRLQCQGVHDDATRDSHACKYLKTLTHKSSCIQSLH